MNPAEPNGAYDAYLLRIWRKDRENGGRWMLQNIRTGEQKGFTDMRALIEFLESKYDKGRMAKDEGRMNE